MFVKADYIETLSKNSLSFETPKETRTHTYQSGNTYEGEWLGGFRHGEGK